jgi:REP element-mobilizing transposase RayT
MKLQEKEYEKMFNPQTMGKLKGLSQQAKEKQGAKNYAGETMRLASEIARAERGYQDELEQLAIEVVKDAYPIVDKYNIKIDAKIEPMSQNTAIPKGEFTDQPGEGEYSPEEKEDMDAKRRLINALTQGAGVRGSRSFLLMKDYLDSVDPTLVDKYGKILDVALGGYDDENFIAQILAGIANDNNMPGGSSLPVYDKANKQWIVKARAINFPILIHEIVKGIYSVIGSRGWSKNKALNQASVASVDKLRNEPDDLRYGKFMLDAISDAISKFYNKSNVSDPYVRDVFMAKLVELPYPQLRDFIQNAINDELSAGQEKWAKDTISKISSLKEYKINKPSEPWEQYGSYKKELEDSYDEFEINSWEDLMAENDGWGDMVPDFGKEIFLKTGLELKGEAWEALDTYCQYLSHLFIIKYSIEKGLIDKDNPKYQKELKNKSENAYYFREKWQQYNSSLKEYKINKPGPHYIIVYNDGTDEIYNLHHFIAPTYQKFKEEFEDMFNQYTFKREIDSKLYLICKDKDEYNDIVNMIERDDSDLEELEDDFKPADETIWKIWPKPKHL